MDTSGKKPPLLNIIKKQVLLLIDWDNLFLSLYDKFKAEIQIERRIKELMKWIENEIGELFGGYGFVFAPEHLSFHYQQICSQEKLRLVTCPKRQLGKPKIDPETGKLIYEEDTVDETIIWFGQMMIRHPDVKFVCLVSGDDGYASFFEQIPSGMKRVLCPPTIDSLSKSKRLVRLVDKHPKTSRKMLLMLDRV